MKPSLIATLFASLILSATTQASSVQERIIGGDSIKGQILPWQTRLIISDQYLCGGSIIAPQWIVTAAHCVADDNGNAISSESIVASVTTEYDSGYNDVFSVPSDKIIVHPEWIATNGSLASSDIALIHVEKPFPEDRVIKLITADELDTLYLDFEQTWVNNQAREPNLIAAGFGKMANGNTAGITNMQYVWLSGAPKNAENCTFYDPVNNTYVNKDKVVCAATPDPAKSKDTCFGDSGGSLIAKLSSKASDKDFGTRLIGATSYGQADCSSSITQAAYASIGYYQDWLYRTLYEDGDYPVDLAIMPTATYGQDPFTLPDTTYLENDTTPTPNEDGDNTPIPNIPDPDLDGGLARASAGAMSWLLALFGFSVLAMRRQLRKSARE